MMVLESISSPAADRFIRSAGAKCASWPPLVELRRRPSAPLGSFEGTATDRITTLRHRL